MGLFEPMHLIIILVIALVIFGPGKIADLGGSLGRAVRDFKKTMNEDIMPASSVETPSRQPEQIRHTVETPVKPVETVTKEAV